MNHEAGSDPATATEPEANCDRHGNLKFGFKRSVRPVRVNLTTPLHEMLDHTAKQKKTDCPRGRARHAILVAAALMLFAPVPPSASLP
jgi:hypothetical protein